MGLQLRMKKPLPRIRPVLRPLAVCAKHLILSPERRLHGVAQPENSPQTQETKLRGESGAVKTVRGPSVPDLAPAPVRLPQNLFRLSSATLCRACPSQRSALAAWRPNADS